MNIPSVMDVREIRNAIIEKILIEHLERLCPDNDRTDAARKRPRRATTPVDYSKTAWGRMLRDNRLKNPRSCVSKKFRRRFRVPFVIFSNVLLLLCITNAIFGKPGSVPVEFKLLSSLRILGRGNCADDFEECSGMKERTVLHAFHMFVINFTSRLYDNFVKFPEGEELSVLNRAYEKMGLPLACGSQDATHVKLGKCPESLKTLCTGKEGYPTLAFQCVAGPNRKNFYCSSYFYGSYNDKTITANDSLCQKIANGALKDVEGVIYEENGLPRLCKGGEDDKKK